MPDPFSRPTLFLAEIVQAASERFPEGYEDAVKRYFRTLSDSEGQE